MRSLYGRYVELKDTPVIIGKMTFEMNIHILSLPLQHLVSMRPKIDKRQDKKT